MVSQQELEQQLCFYYVVCVSIPFKIGLLSCIIQKYTMIAVVSHVLKLTSSLMQFKAERI